MCLCCREEDGVLLATFSSVHFASALEFARRIVACQLEYFALRTCPSQMPRVWT